MDRATCWMNSKETLHLHFMPASKLLSKDAVDRSRSRVVMSEEIYYVVVVVVVKLNRDPPAKHTCR